MARKTLSDWGPRKFRRRLLSLCLLAAIFAAIFIAPPAPAASPPASSPDESQAPAEPAWRSTLPLGSPVLDSAADFHADRASAWSDAGQDFLLLDQDVTFAIGAYGFRAERAVVRVVYESEPGKRIEHLAIYLDNAQPLEGRGAVHVEAGRLLVTVSTTGELNLATNLLRKLAAPPDDALVRDADARYRRYLAAITRPPEELPLGPPLFSPEARARRDDLRAEIVRDAQRYTTEAPPPAPPSPSIAAVAQTQPHPAPTQPRPPAQHPDPASPRKHGKPAASQPGESILPIRGTVYFHADRMIVRDYSPAEQAVLLAGHVTIVYESDPSLNKPGMSLTAQNAVIFVRKSRRGEAALAGQTSARDVHGIYLEDDVVGTDGQYTVRGPRMYYDLTLNKAIMLDAVFYTYDVKRQLPIYIRAEKLRQESGTSWSGQEARLTTTEFADPAFDIAARQITFFQSKELTPKGKPDYDYVATDAHLDFAGIPMPGWPRLAGDVGSPDPLQEISVEFNSHYGALVNTTLDIFALMGDQKPTGVNLLGHADFLGSHGPATGINLTYAVPDMSGHLDSYAMLSDHGEDEIGHRNNVKFDGDLRGYIDWQHRQQLDDGWELSLEFADVSDPTFLETFYPDQAIARTYETSAYLKKQVDDWSFTFLASHDLDSQTVQTTTLQAPGFRVDQTPAVGYNRVGTPLWDDRLTWFSENSLSRMQFRFGSNTPGQSGFTNAQSLLNFGFPADETFHDFFTGEGFPTEFVTRFDTRQEIDAPMKSGMFDVTPYVVGRVTAYDQDVSIDPQDDDRSRFWGAVGTRLHTEVSRSYDDVDIPLLDVHRLRHLIEPHADLSFSGSTVNPQQLAPFDPDVESITQGGIVDLGVRNTLQTQRGGPGRWRSVDWLILNTDVVLRTRDGPTDQSVAQYFDYRPEYSQGGDHFHADLAWMVSDTLSTIGEVTYDFEKSRVAQWRAGVAMDHSPVLSSFVQYEEIADLDERLLYMGFNYKLTPTYTVGVHYTYNLALGRGQTADLTLVRKLPGWRLILMASSDDVDNDKSIRAVLIPDGIGGYNGANLFPFIPVQN